MLTFKMVFVFLKREKKGINIYIPVDSCEALDQVTQ